MSLTICAPSLLLKHCLVNYRYLTLYDCKCGMHGSFGEVQLKYNAERSKMCIFVRASARNTIQNKSTKQEI